VCGDQLQLSSAPSPGYLGTLGRGDAGTLPLRCQGPQGNHPHSQAGEYRWRSAGVLRAVRALGDKLGPVLIQLPPKLTFVEGIVQRFLTTLRELHQGALVLESRHASWFSARVETLLRNFQVARVAADPPKGSELAAQPGGWPGLSYWRLHGSPRTYYSEYDHHWLQGLAKRLQLVESWSGDNEAWVIFDNTVLGHATANAVSLSDALRPAHTRD
jgi:uncharacterized protein YecE (DUF72 family)